MSQDAEDKIARYVREAERAQLEAVIIDLFRAALPMAASEQAALDWLCQRLQRPECGR